MSKLSREQQALDVYLKLLCSKGFGPETFGPRIAFLNRLIPLLTDKEAHGGVYRAAIETIMEEVVKDEWPESLLIAREYFPFWMNDIKAVTQLNAKVIKDTLPMDWKPKNTLLSELWHSVDQEKFGTTDSWALKGYTKALRNEKR